MASYAYCHHLTEKKHLNVPTKTSTSVNDLGAPEDGNLLSQLPYPAETMPIHHLKPTAGMLAWTQ